MTEPRALIVRRLGEKNVEHLCGLVGGTRLTVPGRLANAGRLRELVGDELAVLIVLHFGGGSIYVPLTIEGRGGARTPVDVRKIKRLVGRGWSSDRIARHLGCSERTVNAKRAALRSRAANGSKSDNRKDG